MSEEWVQTPADTANAARRPYRSPRLTLFGDMKSLTAAGTIPGEEGGDLGQSPSYDSPPPPEA